MAIEDKNLKRRYLRISKAGDRLAKWGEEHLTAIRNYKSKDCSQFIRKVKRLLRDNVNLHKDKGIHTNTVEDRSTATLLIMIFSKSKLQKDNFDCHYVDPADSSARIVEEIGVWADRLHPHRIQYIQMLLDLFEARIKLLKYRDSL